MESPIRVLMITSAWPHRGQEATTHFIQRQANFLMAAGVEVEVFHFKGLRQPWRYAGPWIEVRRRLRSRKYDLVHAQFGQSGLLALPKRIPLVVTFRGSDLLGIVSDRDGQHTWVGRTLQAASRLVARQADAVVVVSEHMKQSLPTGVSATVIPSGLDFSLFRPHPRQEARRRLGLDPERPLVLFAGRPTQGRKRYQLAEEAVKILQRSLPAELVVLWGVAHTDVPLYMSAADVLVFTSVQEGSPNVVKEALACDLPVVSVPVGDVPERIRDIEGCELCADERPETIAAALERVLRRGARIRGRVAVESLDERVLTGRLIDLYRRVMGRRAERHAPAAGARIPAPAAAEE